MGNEKIVFDGSYTPDDNKSIFGINGGSSVLSIGNIRYEIEGYSYNPYNYELELQLKEIGRKKD